MEEDINSVIITLKKTLIKKYGKNFKKFYLMNGEEHPWVGLISLSDEEGDRNPQYYNIKEEKVFLDQHQIN